VTLTAVLTRPGGVVDPLRFALEQRGVRSIVQPMIAIEPIPVEDRPLVTLGVGDVCIFISANAAEQGLANLAAQLKEKDCLILAVGSATAKAIAAAGFDVSVPSRADSEGLLSLEALHNVRDRQVVIVKGEGGRGLLAEALKERGAHVVSYVCYRRVPMSLDAGQFCWQLCNCDQLVFQASSGEILERLTEVLGEGGQPNLLDSDVVVPSSRVAEIARELGWSRVHTASGAGDEAFTEVVAALLPEEPPSPEENSVEQGAIDVMSEEKPVSSVQEPAVPTTEPTPAPPAPPVGTVPARRSDTLARSMVTLVLLAMLGVAYFAGWQLWPQYQATLAELEQAQARLAVLETAPDTARETLRGEMTQQLQALEALSETNLAAAAARQSQLLAEQAAASRATAAQVEQLEIRLARLMATDRRVWLANEAAFLVRLAAQRLQGSPDIAAAEALLRSADNLLRQVDDPRFATARQALAADIAALASAPAVDAVGIYARFSALIDQAMQLQVVTQAPSLPTTDSARPEDGVWARATAGWQAAVQRISSYLIIHSRQDDMAGLMTPDWENLVRQNLRMTLEQAQIAALSGNQTLYRHAIGRAEQFAGRFTATDPARVAAMSEALRALAAVDIAPAVPDLVTSRAAIGDALRRIDGEGIAMPSPDTASGE